jgi:hypothetical protein
MPVISDCGNSVLNDLMLDDVKFSVLVVNIIN